MQQQILQCPKCGRQNAIGQQFCGACGEKLQHISPTHGTRVDASQAQMAVRKYLESAYTKHLKDVHFTKCWYSHAGSQYFWDVEGFMLTKKKVRGSKELHFRFQIDPNSGEVLGYESPLQLPSMIPKTKGDGAGKKVAIILLSIFLTFSLGVSAFSWVTYESLQSQNQSLLQRNNQLQQECNQLSQELTNIRASYSQLQSKNQQLTQENQQYREALAEIEAELQRAQQQGEQSSLWQAIISLLQLFF